MGRGIIGCDRSANLIEICGQKGMYVMDCYFLIVHWYVMDCYYLIVIDVSTLQSLLLFFIIYQTKETKERRVHALQELTRIINIELKSETRYLDTKITQLDTQN